MAHALSEVLTRFDTVSSEQLDSKELRYVLHLLDGEYWTKQKLDALFSSMGIGDDVSLTLDDFLRIISPDDSENKGSIEEENLVEQLTHERTLGAASVRLIEAVLPTPAEDTVTDEVSQPRIASPLCNRKRLSTKNLGHLMVDEVQPRLKEMLQASISEDGCLSDIRECVLSELKHPGAVAPFHGFDYRLYRSAKASSALRTLLHCSVPGTSVSFEEMLSAIALESSPNNAQQQNYCYLIGGQVRDILRGQLSTDFDFNYSCSAREVALTTVARGWPTKYKCIGAGVREPNYVLIGDEDSSCYLEGFCVDLNTHACYHDDFTMNFVFYDLKNDVIIDKTGRGVSDIRARSLRLTLSVGETFEAWAAENFSPGNKELRYVKFFLRAETNGEPLSYDAEECAFIVESLRRALCTNAKALREFWFGYTLKAQLKDSNGIAALNAWVTKYGGPTWWEEQWLPLVEACAAPGALSVGNGVA